MNTLSYKGFMGSVAFSEKDNVFFGKIEGINGLVNFEGESVSELTHAFQEAVDDYLAYCKEEGIEPHKSYSGSLNIRISPDTHSRIAVLAKQAGISINAFIKSAIEKQIAASNLYIPLAYSPSAGAIFFAPDPAFLYFSFRNPCSFNVCNKVSENFSLLSFG